MPVQAALRAEVTCPYCWHRIERGDLLLRCGEACPEAERVTFAAKESSDGRCPHGRRPVPRRFCPQCRRPLLREYLDSDGRSIAVIGPADAGKTTYVGVLLHELRGRVAARFNGMALDLLGDESRRNYEERFHAQLFGRGEAVRATPPVRGGTIEPLIFTLKIPVPGGFLRRGGRVRSVLSVFYDASGENVLSAQAMDPLARYLESAGGILLLVDPLQLDAGNVDQIAVVQRLAELLREGARTRGGRLETPLAVAVTKLDLLGDEFGDHSPVRRSGDHAGHYDDDDGADVHEEVRAWLDRRAPGFDNTVAANFATYRYFALSALGEAPLDAKRLSPSGIHPHRVEDPMLWLLTRFGAIAAAGRARR